MQDDPSFPLLVIVLEEDDSQHILRNYRGVSAHTTFCGDDGGLDNLTASSYIAWLG